MNMSFVIAFSEDGARLFVCARKYMCAFVCVGFYSLFLGGGQ